MQPRLISSTRAWLVLLACTLMMVLGSHQRAYAQAPEPDAIGAKTGVMTDVKDAAGNALVPAAPADSDDAKTKAEKTAAVAEFERQKKAEPLAAKLADGVGQSQIAINLVWTLVCGFLVMFMQAGFAMVEAGFCRAKHAAHVIMTNFMIYPIGMLGFWICGFAFMYGSVGPLATLGGVPVLTGTEVKLGDFGILGTKGFFLNGTYDVSVYAFFLFQMVFMDTTATIPTGAMAERWRFTAFAIYGFFISMIVYPIYGHMVWGGGGLAMLGQKYGLGNGVVDFAGSSVVHAVGGFVALAGAIVIGPRIGKFNKDGSANVIPGHHIPMAVIGTFILAFGWFGFNAGSTLGAVGGGNFRIAVIATNTMLASAGGAFLAMVYMKLKTKKYDPGMMVNGLLGGLVAITAPCAFVNATSSVLIGALGAALVIWAVGFIERMGIDDPVGAVAVHGFGGVFGTLCVGIFADGTFGAGLNGVATPVTGLLHGNPKQLIAQAIGAVVCMAWAFGTGYAFFKIQKKLMRIRPLAEDEIAGLDIPEMGVLAYPEFKGSHAPELAPKVELSPEPAAAR